MESSTPVHLSASEIHGFHTIEDLNVLKIMEEAKQRWLQPNEIYAILYNSTLFDIHVRPLDLPPSGTISLFDRKMLRNFRKDGHNWKKKKDGKTVKEAHEHLKVGNEERIHVYYAHGEDSSSFVRRCYWLLDKTREHIVLVHYRETSELGSPVTTVTSNSGPTHSGTSASMVLSGQTDSGVDHHAFYSDSGTSLIGESIELGDKATVGCHERTLHDINTLEWDDLLVTNDSNGFTEPKRDDISCLEQQNQHEVNDSISNVSLLPCNNNSGRISSFGNSIEAVTSNACVVDTKLPSSECFQNMGNQTDSDVQSKPDDMLDIFGDGLPAQDSFRDLINYVITDSPGSYGNQQVETPISTGHESIVPAQASIQEQFFSINDISPTWAFSMEQTKIMVFGYFNGEVSHLVESNLFFVFGDSCVPAEMVQVGVFRCMTLPHNPGFVNLYLSLDGRTPISQIMTFEYRPPLLEYGLTSLEDKSKWEEFQVQIRLSCLLFSTTDSLNSMSTKVSPSALKEAKKFAQKTSTDKEWAQLIKSIGNNEISFPQAKNKLFEITLKKKLQEWLLGRMVEGCKTPARDRQGQGIIHLCAILGYTWAVRPYVTSGLSIDFRDAHGWTALHWAAYRGREKMVAVLLSMGSDPSLVTDPTSEFPGGCIAADLASKNGYDGLAAYLAEKGLTEHFRRMALSGNVIGSLQTSTTDSGNPNNLSEEQLCQKDTLAAYRTAADAATRIQAAFRENSLKTRTKAAESSNPETEARGIIAAMKIQHAFRNYDSRKRMKAAARIQYRFRTWQIRKDFLNKRKLAIKIQAIFRGHQVRKQYHKILWSVGVLEKAILRWRLKRKGMRGLQTELTMPIIVDQEKENDVEEEFFQISRKQAEERVERSVVRVQALFRSHRAQQEYRRMKMTYDQTKLEELFEPDDGNDW